MLFLSSFILSQCAVFSDKFSEEKIEPGKYDDNSYDEFDITPDEEISTKDGVTKLIHPARANAWNTKVLVMTSPTPRRDSLETCRTEMEAIARYLLSTDDLLVLRERLGAEIGRNFATYHWCFYYAMVYLDDRLHSDNLGTLLEDRYKNFHTSMRALWLLAESLDQENRSNRYFNYLRSRYLQINRDFFGREIDVIMTPLGRQYDLEKIKMIKPAKKFSPGE